MMEGFELHELTACNAFSVSFRQADGDFKSSIFARGRHGCFYGWIFPFPIGEHGGDVS